MNILHILYRQLPIEVNCVSLSTYTFIYLYMILHHFISMMVHTFPLLLYLT